MVLITRNIWYCNVDKFDNYEWKLNDKVKLPHKVSYYNYDVLLIFTHLLFIFYFNSDGDIWCLDLRCNKPFKINHNTPHYFGGHNTFAFEGKNKFIHIIDFLNGNHCKICSYDLITNELNTFYSKYYNLLIMGFISGNESNEIIPTIPIVIKQLIYKYFPLFM